MAVFAVVSPSGGIVTNTIVGEDLDTVEGLVGSCVEMTEATGVAGIGYTWDPETQTFIAPVE